jgi:hypothetical protein
MVTRLPATLQERIPGSTDFNVSGIPCFEIWRMELIPSINFCVWTSLST